MILVLIFAYRNNLPKGEPIPLRQALKIAVDAIWGLVTVIIIMGGILSGIFTPTESAAVACVWAFFVTMFIYRSYRWRDLPLLIGRVVRTVGMVMIMIGFSVAFGYMMALMRIPAHAAEFFTNISSDKYTFLLYVNILLLVLGTFMDLAPMLLICTPVFLPVIAEVRHRSGAFRHHHDLQPRDRIADAPGRADAGGRLRHRQGHHGAGIALDHDVLRADADRPAPRHLHSGAVAVATEGSRILAGTTARPGG